jgi:serine/threonine protein kinase
VNDQLVDQTLGKYELRERIGRGGMAEVYKAYHAALDRFVAIKILHPFLGEEPEFKGRFEREARNVARLRHPNIIHVYDFEFDPRRDLYYMVMEYIDGLTLRDRLAETGAEGEPIPIDEAIRIVTPLASAIAYAHSRGMVHRDIKPANIMIDADERVVLTDFGIARMVSGPNVTASGSMVGTPAYMSPEQGLGQAGDHRSDIYSLGVVLYQLVTGATPFDADTPIGIVLRHVNDPLPPPTTLNPDIPEPLEAILFKSLDKDPDRRYQDAALLEQDLRALQRYLALGEQKDATPLPELTALATVQPAPMETNRQGSCLLWLVLLLAALTVAVGGVYASYSGLLQQYIPLITGPIFQS